MGGDALHGGNFTSLSTHSTITDSSPDTSKHFGNRSAIYGNRIAITSRFEDVGATPDAGAVIVYDLSGNQLYKVDNPSPNTNDGFGVSLSISDKYLVVGAWRDDTDDTDSGAAYVYDVEDGSLLYTLTNPAPAANREFGWVTAVSGEYAIIKADGASNVYIYDLSDGLLEHTLTETGATGNYGEAFDVYGDYLLLSDNANAETYSNEGTVYLYQRSIFTDNPYLERCLGELDKEADSGGLDTLLQKFKSPEGQKSLQRAIMLSVTLDYLTDKIVHNRGYLEKVTKTLGMSNSMSLETAKNMFKYGVAGGAKKSTVDYLINNFVKGEREGKDVDPRLGQGLMSLNVFEMFVVDIASNGQVGRDLSQFQYGTKSGRGDARREEGENIISWPVAGSSQKENDDMYMSWNLNFVSGSDKWPFFMAKLANKTVADYREQPEHFMHPRVVALYLFIEWHKGAEKNDPVMRDTQMRDDNMREVMGRANLQNMQEFSEKSSDAPKSTFFSRMGRLADALTGGRITAPNM